MKLVQIRFPTNVTQRANLQGSYGGYYNYEFCEKRERDYQVGNFGYYFSRHREHGSRNDYLVEDYEKVDIGEYDV